LIKSISNDGQIVIVIFIGINAGLNQRAYFLEVLSLLFSQLEMFCSWRILQFISKN